MHKFRREVLAPRGASVLGQKQLEQVLSGKPVSPKGSQFQAQGPYNETFLSNWVLNVLYMEQGS